MKRFADLSKRYGFLPLLLVFLVVFFSLSSPRFLQVNNFQNILYNTGILAVVSFGQFFTVLSGGIDFSNAMMIALASVTFALSIPLVGIFGAVIAALLACMLFGFLNGFLITKFSASPMIVTLGMMWVINGVNLILTSGQVVYGIPEYFQWFGNGRVLGLPITIIVAVAAFVIFYFLLHNTVFGKNLYALGANEKAAFLSGINVKKGRVICYIICGLCAAITGLMLTGSLGTGQPSLGLDLAMTNFIAVFVAGVRWGGGEGSLFAVGMGALFVAIMQNGLNILGVSSFIQQIIIGLVLVVALTVDIFRTRWAAGERGRRIFWAG